MDSFAKKQSAERREIFQEAASRRDVLPIVIEKDFWVCWTLKRLFTAPQLAPYITFKGGTGYSGENGQWLCRESGRRSAVKTATIPVKTARR